VNRESRPAESGHLALWKQDLEREARYLGEIVSPLVIEHDSTITPLSSRTSAPLRSRDAGRGTISRQQFQEKKRGPVSQPPYDQAAVI
jgi:hypothetical protein